MRDEDIVYVFQHQCGCERQLDKVFVNPAVKNGAVFLVRPICIENGAMLVMVGKETKDNV